MKERGQGLVEMALILPFLLILIVGITEGGIALHHQLIVVNAAREGARFGAYGAELDAVRAQTLLAASKIIEFNEENAVIAVIYAETNNPGTAFNKWTVDIYPDGKSVPHVTKKKMLADLRAGCPAGDQSPCAIAANLKMVIVDVRYEHRSLMGFPIIGALADRIPIGSWTAMPMTPGSQGGK